MRIFKTQIEELRKEDNLAGTFAEQFISNLIGITIEEHHWPIIETAAIMLADSERQIDKWHHKYFAVVNVLSEIVKDADV